LKYLNVNCQLKEGLFCKIETRVSYHIKRKREEAPASRKEGEQKEAAASRE
jgi:hypothetical protein